MDAVQKATRQYFTAATKHFEKTEKLLKESVAPVNSIENLSKILLATIQDKSEKRTKLSRFENIHNKVVGQIETLIEKEIALLKVAEETLLALSKDLELKFSCLEKSSRNITTESICGPRVPHLLEWGNLWWNYQHLMYLGLSQVLIFLNPYEPKSIRQLRSALTPNPATVEQISRIRAYQLGEINVQLLWLKMDIQGPELVGMEFSMYSPEEIKRLSVVEVRTPLCLNALGHPLKDGLYDTRMGPSGERSDPCATCKQTAKTCPGHFGHIELPLPVVNPLYHKGLYSLLRMSCLSCHRILLPGKTKFLLIQQLRLADAGMVVEAQSLEELVNGIGNDGTPDSVVEVLVRDELAAHVTKITPAKEDSHDTTFAEALRAQFLSDALKQQMKGKTCSYCKSALRPVTINQNRLMCPMSKVEVAEKFKDGASSSKRVIGFILPKESKQLLRDMWTEEKELILELFPVLKKTSIRYPTDLFFIEVVMVPPPKVRPLNYLDGKILESSQARVYKSILNDCIILRNIRRMIADNSTVISAECKAIVAAVKGQTLLEKMNQCWAELQSDVDHLLDVEMNTLTSTPQCQGLKQIIEKKEGVLRMHMMGKRVNFAARSVITPDPNLNIEEIGIPQVFAKKLTVPVRVNMLNIEQLRQLVENGPDIYPGATLVENENGSIIKLMGGAKNRTKRAGFAKLLLKTTDPDRLGGKIVHRHLMNGDPLLLNRQPTLHRPSIMAHKARILNSEKTVRMHYSNCKSYNADFDGDEMNVHCPQSDLARSEALHIVNVPNQYLVPKDGTPLGGLIQDHVISGVHLTVRGQMFLKQEYQQLVYQGLSHVSASIKLLPPCILKPKMLWSGKQVVSTILLNIIPKGQEPLTLVAAAKTSIKSWEKTPPRKWRACVPFKDPKTMSEAEVIIHRGQLLCGVLDKQHFGATQYSLTHCLFELYGGECSSKLLNSLAKLFTFYLQCIGFTIGVADILVKRDADEQRTQKIEEARAVGDIAASRALDLDTVPDDLMERLEEAYFQDPIKFRARLDNEYKKALDEYTNAINKVCLPSGLIQKFPKNNLQLMVVSGAKGSTVNTMQISCLLGQIELEGKRPPLTLSGRSLPSFRPFETSPRAGGYVDGRFMTGITPQDFFFHCMAGREGLIDTAVKTSRSGYLQRCLIKHLEGVSVGYDHTVRNHDGSVVQFLYGEDGMEVSKATFLNKDQINFLFRNRNSIIDKSVVAQLKDREIEKKVKNTTDIVREWRREHSGIRARSAFTRFSAAVLEQLPHELRSTVNPLTGRVKAYRKCLKKWKKLSTEDRDAWRGPSCPDPVTATYRSYRDFGAITEALDWLVEDYLRTKQNLPEKMFRSATKSMRNLISLKSMRGLCQPGEPVGLLAAQSVGEPSTQMTLNTFHFAGRGEMNVTLGIPRLREILMTASKHIKTPSMDIPLLVAPNMEKRADKLKRTLQRVTVAHVLEKVSVEERLEIEPERLFTYTVRFDFLPYRCYRKQFTVNPQQILKHMEKRFLADLSRAVRALSKKFGEIIHSKDKDDAKVNNDEDFNADDPEPPKVPKKQDFGEEHVSSDEEEEKDDDDATAARLRARHEEAREYEEPTDTEPSEDEDEGDLDETPKGIERDEEEEVPEVSDRVLKNAEQRRAMVVTSFAIIRNYKFDMDKEEWCELLIGVPISFSKIDFSGILRDICEASVIYQVPQIRRAIVAKSNKGEVAIKTEGINIHEMFRFDRVLNLRRLYCNDIHEIANTYGIEAAGRVIVKELQGVFRVYGITVDPRHLLLIADYMTMQGVFLPMNRTGLAACPSPFHQMTFESSIAFLRTALFRGKRDDLLSPSARIMVGRACRSGTGAFDVYPAPQASSV